MDQAICADLIRLTTPMMLARARRATRVTGLDADDLVQEYRMALFRAMKRFDYNKGQGRVLPFASSVVDKCTKTLICKATRGCPRIAVEVDGETKVVSLRNLSLNDLVAGRSDPFSSFDRSEAWLASEDETPERVAAERNANERLRAAKMKLLNSLNDRERAIFACFSHPSDEFRVFVRNEGLRDGDEIPNELVGRFLGIGKNAVDWSIHLIKRQVGAILEADFSDVLEEAIDSAKWPMIFVSHRESDHDFVRDLIREHQLDTRPLEPRTIHVSTGKASRTIERYRWGTVMEFRLGDRAATIVTFGRFNEITGEVLVQAGYWKSIREDVPWYHKLHTTLKASHEKDAEVRRSVRSGT